MKYLDNFDKDTELGDIFYDSDFLMIFKSFINDNIGLINSYKLLNELKEFIYFFKDIDLYDIGYKEKIIEKYSLERLFRLFSFLFSCETLLKKFLFYIQKKQNLDEYTLKKFDIGSFSKILDKLITINKIRLKKEDKIEKIRNILKEKLLDILDNKNEPNNIFLRFINNLNKIGIKFEKIKFDIINNGKEKKAICSYYGDNSDIILFSTDENLDEITYENLLHFLLGNSEEEDDINIPKNINLTTLDKNIDVKVISILSNVKELFGLSYIHLVVCFINNIRSKCILTETGNFIEIAGELIYEIEELENIRLVEKVENTGGSKNKFKKYYKLNKKIIISESKLEREFKRN